MKKNITSLLMSLMLSLFVLASCGNNTTTTETTTKEATTEEASQTTTEDANKTAEVATEETTDTNNAGEETEIVFWHAMGAGQGEALQKLVAEFEEANPNIKVNLQFQGNYGDLNQMLVAAMQSPQDLPTITQANQDLMLQFQEANLVTDLTDMVKGENGIEDYEDILPGLREEIEQTGRIMALPFNKSTEVFWYNKTLFDELGLNPPTNYDELKEVAKSIYDAKGYAGVGFDSLPNMYVSYLYNQGIEVSKDFDVTSQESVDAINYYQEGMKEGYFRIPGTDQFMSGPFANEQVGAYMGSIAGEVYVRDGVDGKFEYAAAPYPAKYSPQQGANIYMFESATDEQKKAAFELEKFLLSKDSQIQWAVATGYMPSRTSGVEDDEYKNSDSKIAAILDEASKDLYFRKASLGGQQAFDDLNAFLEQVFTNPDADVKAELEAFAPQFQSSYAQ